MAVYLVGREGATQEEKPHIVEARTQASAVAYVGRKTLAAQVISVREAMEWAKRGCTLETAKDDQDEAGTE